MRPIYLFLQNQPWKQSIAMNTVHSLVGILVGILLVFARFDFHWWGHLRSALFDAKFNPKSIVPAGARAEAAHFYSSVQRTPSVFYSTVLAFVIIIIIAHLHDIVTKYNRSKVLAILAQQQRASKKSDSSSVPNADLKEKKLLGLITFLSFGLLSFLVAPIVYVMFTRNWIAHLAEKAVTTTASTQVGTLLAKIAAGNAIALAAIVADLFFLILAAE